MKNASYIGMDGVDLRHKQKMRTNDSYNLNLIDYARLDSTDMPIIDAVHYVPKSLIGFNEAMSSNATQSTVHFFIDDYMFERIWKTPEHYAHKLEKFKACLTPDFSLYTDMPLPLQQWNIYRSRLIGAYWQRCGMVVIPTLSWSTEKSYDFCFSGLAIGGIYAVSTTGIKKKRETLELYNAGLTRAIEQLRPKAILEYGGSVDFDYGNIEVIRFKNSTIERLEHGRTRRSQR